MKTREQSINWWNDLFEYINPSGINKSELTEKYFGKDRRYQSLTGSEIEEIWRKEVKTGENNIYLNRLKEKYKDFYSTKYSRQKEREYKAICLFCLDTNLVSPEEIQLMQSAVIISF